MNELLLKKIDEAIDLSRKEIADLTIKFVNIKSVQDTPAPNAPFGLGVKKVLDTAVQLGKEEGFYTTDYKVGVISAALKDSSPDLGIWIHGDVVPEGEGWSFEPYNAVEYEGRIVGRGAGDNKGQLAAFFTLLKIFKNLGIELKYNPALFVGSNEETGKFDLIGNKDIPGADGFLNLYTAPKLSLVPDGGFPVGYGGKGHIQVRIKSTRPLEGMTFTAGLPEAPGKATVLFADGTKIETFSPPIHSAHPDPNGNMITEISRKMLDKTDLPEYEAKIFEFFEKISSDITGTMFGLDIESKSMTPLTLAAFKIENNGGCPELYTSIRFPIELTADDVREKISAVCEKYGLEISGGRVIHNPYLLDRDTEIVNTLCKIANEVNKSDKQPYILGGGTYAHELPNAYVFGSSANLRPESWDKGRGGAHGIDEVVSLDRLQTAMKIYARALLALNEMDW